MAKHVIPQNEYTPCPEGQHRGVICDVEDLGMVETQFGDKHKFAVKIESHSAKMDDGKPYSVQVRYNRSSSPKSNFVKLRQTMAGKQLSRDQRAEYDDDELLNRRVGFVVTHNTNDTGTWANVDQIWPLDDPPEQAALPPQSPEDAPEGAEPDVPGDEPPPLDDQELPF